MAQNHASASASSVRLRDDNFSDSSSSKIIASNNDVFLENKENEENNHVVVFPSNKQFDHRDVSTTTSSSGRNNGPYYAVPRAPPNTLLAAEFEENFAPPPEAPRQFFSTPPAKSPAPESPVHGRSGRNAPARGAEETTTANHTTEGENNSQQSESGTTTFSSSSGTNTNNGNNIHSGNSLYKHPGEHGSGPTRDSNVDNRGPRRAQAAQRSQEEEELSRELEKHVLVNKKPHLPQAVSKFLSRGSQSNIPDGVFHIPSRLGKQSSTGGSRGGTWDADHPFGQSASSFNIGMMKSSPGAEPWRCTSSESKSVLDCYW